jgi:hypothetical protein
MRNWFAAFGFTSPKYLQEPVVEASVKVRKGIEKAMGLPEDNCGNRESKEINPCAETAIRRT